MRIRRSLSSLCNRGSFSIARACSLMLLLCAASAGRINAQQPAGNETTGSPPPMASNPVSAVSQTDSWYRIGPGDVLEVRVFNRPQLSVTVRVNDRGQISVPLLGDEVPASCRTERELTKEIAARFVEGKYLRNPQVDVFIKEYQATPVAVIGAVNGPGRFQLQRRVRLLELLMFAGGPAQSAGRTIQILHTTATPPCDPTAASVVVAATPVDSMEKSMVTYKLSDTMTGREDANPYVWPGDIVTIPDAGQVLILGNVAKPGPLAVNEQTTLSNAIALAGGLLPDSKSGSIRILRPVPGSTAKTEMTVNLTAIRKRQADDVLLQAGDIVEVPTSTGVGSILKGMMRTIVPTITSLPVRVIRPY